MKTLRRYNLKQAWYFITVVTYRREKLLLLDPGLFWDCWNNEQPNAWIIMPDHFHVIIDVAEGDISSLMHQYKITYSRKFRQKYRPGRVWQNRFWDHVIRNQRDLNHHLDYIHYNPVKHGMTNDPFDYAHSSLKAYYEAGNYGRDWGVTEDLEFDGEFGE